MRVVEPTYEWPTVSKQTVIMTLEEICPDPVDRDRVINHLYGQGIIGPTEIIVAVGWDPEGEKT